MVECDDTRVYLAKKWSRIMEYLEISEQIARIGFNRFLTAYENKDRNYHGIKHVENMLKAVEAFNMDNPKQIHHPNILNFAIFMHDFVNGCENDVAESVVAAAKFLRYSKSKNVFDKQELVCRFILATQHDDKPVTGKLLEEQLIADTDLLILGSEKSVYDEYARQIRQEYAQYPNDAFAKGRTAVLKRFLDREQIFGLDYFKDKFEERARSNMRCEIKSLSKNNSIALEVIQKKNEHVNG